ncbi:hypothetical protein [Microbacterium sp. 179-I 3D3 NHS]|uniref:hypothetical protein n=1 Tax=unclassified Microbacterium TaxID=2609290 RepID=UPI0039A16BBC
MAPRTRLAAAVTPLVVLLLLAGCTSSPGSDTPTSSPAPSADGGGDLDDLEGTLLDDGRMFAVVTWGSSGCVPQVEDVSAEGQTVTVVLADLLGDEDAEGEEKACTADYAPRASLGALPDGVDPTAEITLEVTYRDARGDVDLDGNPAFTGVPGTSTEYQPSAGWFDDEGLVLLTWGSSSCPPVVESVEGSGNAGTVTFVTQADQVCTMDIGPRGTIVSFGDSEIDDDDFTLTLSGGGLEGSVTVQRG